MDEGGGFLARDETDLYYTYIPFCNYFDSLMSRPR